MKKIRRVVCGMSGGVDSSVAALLLKRKGFEVVGAFMRNWEATDEVGECSLDQDLADAAAVCKDIGIPLVETNFVKDYWNYVFSETLDDYEAGYTPNPDMLCNHFIKFGAFYRYCKDRLRADAIATGHYVRTDFGPYLEHFRESADVKMLRGTDSSKDQSFFLARVQQEALRHCAFPLGNLLKTDVRRMARDARLRVADKPDSMGICFIGRRNFQPFIEQYLEPRPGTFVDIDTNAIVGSHNGIHQWTIGQRCNLSGYLKPYYVARKDPATQTIHVASGSDHPALHGRRMTTASPHWIAGRPPDRLLRDGKMECGFRFQHMYPLVRCRLEVASTERLDVTLLDGPLRALTPGQYAVFYDGEECLGSSRIQTVDYLSERGADSS